MIITLWVKILKNTKRGERVDWTLIGKRIRTQREYLGYTREAFAEKIEVTPKFCSDIELGVKGMSVPTLCRISKVLNLSTDYILFGSEDSEESKPCLEMLRQCPKDKKHHLEEIIKVFLLAIQNKTENQ